MYVLIKKTVLGFVSFISLAISAFLIKFGFDVMIEDANDSCHTSGGSIDYFPDVRWFGLALIMMALFSVSLASVTNRKAGSVLVWLVLSLGLILLALPELAA